MITWNNILEKLYHLRMKCTGGGYSKSNKEYLSKDKSIAFLTFRITVDGVGRLISDQVLALKELRKNGEIQFSNIVLISGWIDLSFWNQCDLCDLYYNIPELGLDCIISKKFYTPCSGDINENKIAQELWDRANFIADKIEEIAKNENIGLIIIENVNSLPYNICASLSTVIASEKQEIPVINICHDFYWEHRNGTISNFFSNEGNPHMFGIIKILSPWSSPLWIQATTTQTAKRWLIDRGWEKANIEVIPGSVKNYSKSYSKKMIIKLIDEIKINTIENFSIISGRRTRICRSKNINLQKNKKPYVILLPTKISSGKGIDCALQFLQKIFMDTLISKLYSHYKSLCMYCYRRANIRCSRK